MASTANVSAAKPKVTGAVSVAPLNTTLPTNSAVALGDAFKSLGYIHEDGMTEDVSRESEEVKAWGGDVVINTQTTHNSKFTFTLIEALNPEVLKVVFGDSNVTGALATGITVKSNSKELESHAWVIDTIMREGVLQRTCIPIGKVTEIGEVTYSDSDAVGYEVTITCEPDSAGNKFYQYTNVPNPTPDPQ